jgi:uncharacterized protein (DUF4415 family)
MIERKPDTEYDSAGNWIDPDDAPELTDAFFERADHHIGGKLVRRGRKPKLEPKVAVSIRLSADVVRCFKEEGAGWQTRIDMALQEWLDQKARQAS